MDQFLFAFVLDNISITQRQAKPNIWQIAAVKISKVYRHIFHRYMRFSENAEVKPFKVGLCKFEQVQLKKVDWNIRVQSAEMQRGFYAILSQSSLTGWVGTLTNTWAGAESLWRWRVLHNWKSRCQLCAVQQRKCKKNVRLSYDIRRCSWRAIKASTEWQEHSTPSNLIKAIIC